MTRVRQAARRDGNHNEIVGVFKSLGCSWFDTSAISAGLDGVVGVNGVDQRVEIKNPDALRGKAQALALTQSEQDTFDEWLGRKPKVVQTVDDAIELVKLLKREKR